VDSLLDQTRAWLTVDAASVQIMRDSDDQLDALLCALVTRAADLGRIQHVGDPASAATEGWTRLPLADLSRTSEHKGTGRSRDGPLCRASGAAIYRKCAGSGPMFHQPDLGGVSGAK
jgi:hypothetical protein